MKSLLEILNLSTDFLKKKGIASPKRQAEEVLSDALGLSRVQLYMQFDRPLTDAELVSCRSCIVRRGSGEPSQYIHGKVDFYGCYFRVNSHVLIPRQETELLADKIAQSLTSQNLAGKTLWDVCCGSGCLGISLKKKFPELTVILSDLSPDALAIAKENGKENQVEVLFLEGDLLHPFKGQKADFFVCNPPYVSEEEYQNLEREVKDYEPKMALVAGPQGLQFYEKLAQELKGFLQPRARVWMEIGDKQAESVMGLFSRSGWAKTAIEKDFSGKNRFFFLENE